MKSVRNALRVFEAVAERQPVGVSELARALVLPKATVQRALVTLGEAGWLRPEARDPSGRPGRPGGWVVGARCARLAQAAPRAAAIRAAAGPHLQPLRDRTRESVMLFALDGERLALLASEQSPQVVRASPGDFGAPPLHATAAGRAVLAFLPEARRRALLAGGLPRFTDASITEAGALAAELAGTRARGYAVSHGEYQPDLAGVAAPILDGASDAQDGPGGPGDTPIGSLTVFGPTHRFDPAAVESVARLVTEVCAEIGRELRGRAGVD